MAALSQADARRIEEAIAEVERATAGEVVVASVRQSGAYGAHRGALAAVWTVVLAALVHILVPDLPLLWVLGAQLPVWAGFYAAAGAGPLVRLVVPPAVVDLAVRRRAMQLFIERGVHDTRDRSGLLLMISELEHRVVILGDAGIHARVTTEGWQRHVAQVVEGIRQGRAGEAVVSVLHDLGDILAAAFPPRPDDVDELPNRLVRE